MQAFSAQVSANILESFCEILGIHGNAEGKGRRRRASGGGLFLTHFAKRGRSIVVVVVVVMVAVGCLAGAGRRGAAGA